MDENKGLPRFMSFFGGKTSFIDYYPPPRHGTIVEPFAGGASYARRYWQKDVLLIEANPVIAGIWDFLIHASEQDILDLPLLRPEDDLRDVCTPGPRCNLIGFWVNPAVGSPRWHLGSWARARYPDLPANYWGKKCRARIAANIKYIKHWQMVQGDYSLAPVTEDATYFIDPPYKYCSSYSMPVLDYDILGEWCRAIPG